MNEIAILGPQGDLRLTWDPEIVGERERARMEVARLKASGYSFFVGEEPADEVAAGRGELVFRRVAEPEAELVETEIPVAAKGRRSIAVPPMQGG